ncbi:UNVERIFIED_CONTAM: FtsW/RodA/SpoVE family cell cycle protein, partial [Microbacterium sp. SLM126]
WFEFIVALAILGVPVGLIAKQPDLGTGLLVLAAGLYVNYFAGLSWKIILPLLAVGVVAITLLVAYESQICAPGVNWPVLHDYQQHRVCTLLDPTTDPLGKGFHTIQSIIAIGSGGVTGKGWLKGTQTHLEFIPEKHTDFIFAVFSEEFGLIGNAVLLVLYLLLIFRGLYIAANAPTLFSRLLAYLQEQGIDQPVAPALRYLYTGAGPLDLSLKRRVEAMFGLALHHGYGLSEYAGSVHVTRLGEQRPDTSAGYAVAEAEVQVTDSVTGQPLPLGTRGELWLRGRGLMPGYFRDAAATAAVMREGGWYASGDLGEMHADGALFVVGRLKEMIIRSGFNVYPAEVETALNAHPSIQRSAVVGCPEQDGNEEIVAFVELRPGAGLDTAALHGHLRERLAPYKRPARIVALPELPTNNNGKILKRVLQEQAGSMLTQ